MGVSRSTTSSAARPPRPLYTAPLYTVEQQARRDRSRWTVVQGVLAPVQFLIFVVSAVLVVRCLATDQGLLAANVSVVTKTLALYAIMLTGALWEHDVFGRYLFAPAFFWEDVVSGVVIALHSAYLVALGTGWLAPRPLLVLALAAYATYVVNAAQFVAKLRRARRSRQKPGENSITFSAQAAA